MPAADAGADARLDGPGAEAKDAGTEALLDIQTGGQVYQIGL